MPVFIKALTYYLPQNAVSNQELVKEFPEWTVEKIAEKVGVEVRHVASEKETATDLAVNAANRLFEEHPEIDKNSIDYILFCTQSPDYLLPTSACIMQDRLGMRTDIGALDYNLGCSGYVYGLSLAKGLIEGKIATNVLLLTGETYNKHLHPRDKGNRTIFGDAATASLISTEGFARIDGFALGTDGRGADNLIIKTGGTRNPEKVNDLTFDENGNPISSDYLHMNGAEIFSFTQRNVPRVVKSVLAKNELTMEDINLFIFHQANRYMLEFLRKKIKIPQDKFYIDMANVGNTVSNSIAISLSDAKNEDKLSGKILLCGFGVGYSWGATVLTVE